MKGNLLFTTGTIFIFFTFVGLAGVPALRFLVGVEYIVM